TPWIADHGRQEEVTRRQPARDEGRRWRLARGAPGAPAPDTRRAPTPRGAPFVGARRRRRLRGRRGEVAGGGGRCGAGGGSGGAGAQGGSPAKAAGRLKSLWLDRLAADAWTGRNGLYRSRGDLRSFLDPRKLPDAIANMLGDSSYWLKDAWQRGARMVRSSD